MLDAELRFTIPKQSQLFMPVILATQETEMRRITVQSQPREINL
jgi:hypothetical protein